MRLFSADIAISLVDDAFIFATQNEPAPLVAPAYIAFQKGTKRILALGNEPRADQNVSTNERSLGLMPSLVRLTERIKTAIRSLPNDKQYLLSRTTIHVTGMAAHIPGLAPALVAQLGYAVKPFDASIHPSIEGCKTVMKELSALSKARGPY